MASQPKKKTIQDLIPEYELLMAAAFYEVVDDLKRNAQLTRIAAALEAQNIAGAIKLFRLDSGALTPMLDAIRTIFTGGGKHAVDNMPTMRESDGSKIVVRFNGTNPRAEQYLRENAARQVTNIIDAQRETLREVLTNGMNRGVNPNNLARDIVGRVDKATGKRVGGIIGLSKQQAEFSNNARQELLSGDITQLKNYLTRARRDARFDATILKAINGDGKIDAQTVSKIIGRYEDRLLALRGETIARTEAIASLSSGQEEAFKQAIDRGAIQAQNLRRIWRSAGDKRVRDSHKAMDSESVKMGERFSNGLMYPCDPSGALEEVINCRCTLEYRVDYLANIK